PDHAVQLEGRGGLEDVEVHGDVAVERDRRGAQAGRRNVGQVDDGFGSGLAERLDGVAVVGQVGAQHPLIAVLPAHHGVSGQDVVAVLAQVGHYRAARLPARSRHANPLYHRQSFLGGTWVRLAELPDGAVGGVGEGDAEFVALGPDLLGARTLVLLARAGA